MFVVLDHATCEGLGIHVAKIGNRFEVLDPLRPAIRMAYGFGESVAWVSHRATTTAVSS